IGFGRYYAGYTDWWSFDPATSTWKQLPDYPSGNTGATVFAINDTLYAGQPYYENGIVRKYDPINNNWQLVPSSFPKNVFVNCFTLGSKAFIIGGKTNGQVIP